MNSRLLLALALSGLALLPVPRAASAQVLPPAPPAQTASADDQIGQVATLQGSATVTRGNTSAALAVNDPIHKGDVLQTAANSSLGVTFDDETTFSLTANARIVVNEFVYQEGAQGNAALFNVARGTVAFVASQVAKTGDMKIATPTATLGIRGTTGVVDAAAENKIKLYPDADGRVGRIEVFDRQGGRLGILTQAASAFAIRPAAGGRFAAVPFQIPPQEVARDRGVVQRLFASHVIGRQLAIQRRQLRIPGLPRPGGQLNRNLRGPLAPNLKPAQPAGGLRQNLQKLNPFAKKKRPELR